MHFPAVVQEKILKMEGTKRSRTRNKVGGPVGLARPPPTCPRSILKVSGIRRSVWDREWDALWTWNDHFRSAVWVCEHQMTKTYWRRPPEPGELVWGWLPPKWHPSSCEYPEWIYQADQWITEPQKVDRRDSPPTRKVFLIPTIEPLRKPKGRFLCVSRSAPCSGHYWSGEWFRGCVLYLEPNPSRNIYRIGGERLASSATRSRRPRGPSMSIYSIYRYVSAQKQKSPIFLRTYIAGKADRLASSSDSGRGDAWSLVSNQKPKPAGYRAGWCTGGCTGGRRSRRRRMRWPMGPPRRGQAYQEKDPEHTQSEPGQ